MVWRCRGVPHDDGAFCVDEHGLRLLNSLIPTLFAGGAWWRGTAAVCVVWTFYSLYLLHSLGRRERQAFFAFAFSSHPSFLFRVFGF